MLSIFRPRRDEPLWLAHFSALRGFVHTKFLYGYFLFMTPELSTILPSSANGITRVFLITRICWMNETDLYQLSESSARASADCNPKILPVMLSLLRCRSKATDQNLLIKEHTLAENQTKPHLDPPSRLTQHGYMLSKVGTVETRR